MKKLAPILLPLVMAFSCSDNEEETVYEKYNGTWNIEHQFVNGNEIEINSCDSSYSKILIIDKENSAWVFCHWSITHHPMEFSETGDGNLDVWLKPTSMYETNKTFISAKITGDVFEMTYQNYNDPNSIRVDQFRKE